MTQEPTERSALKLTHCVIAPPVQRRRAVTGVFWLAVLMLLRPYGVGIATAQTENRIVANPPMLEIQQGTLPKSTLLALPAAPRMTDKKTLDLNIVYTQSSIYNPAADRADKV